jgi:Zincin-like metallopeptidase
VSAGFFAPLDVPSVSGRDLIDDDARNSDHVVIVSQSLALRTVPSVDAGTPTPTTPPSPTRRRTGPHTNRACARLRHHTFRVRRLRARRTRGGTRTAFLCADLDLTREPREEHAAYIANWLDVLTADNRAIVTAASPAQRAAFSSTACSRRHPPATYRAWHPGAVSVLLTFCRWPLTLPPTEHL